MVRLTEHYFGNHYNYLRKIEFDAFEHLTKPAGCSDDLCVTNSGCCWRFVFTYLPKKIPLNLRGVGVFFIGTLFGHIILAG
jgi:hypothetical protein